MPRWVTSSLRLLAGLLLFDLLLNVPGFDPARPVVSLLMPSIDLLVIVAACITFVRTPASAHRTARLVVAGLTVAFMACIAGERLGYDVFWRLFGGQPVATAMSCLFCAAVAAGAFLAAYHCSVLIASGIETPMVRNVFLFAVALAVLLQVLLNIGIFGTSVVPKVVRTIGALFG